MNRILLFVALVLLLPTKITAQHNPAIITSKGIAPLMMKTAIRTLPASVPGLYDKIKKVEYMEGGEGGDVWLETRYEVYLKGEAMLYFFEDEGIINSLQFISPRLKTSHGLSGQSTAGEIFSSGCKYRIEQWNDGTVYVFCDGLIFVSLEMTPSGLKKMERGYLYGDVTFDKSDFKPSGKAAIVYNDRNAD